MNLPYSEGTLFLVPLQTNGFARGVVARSTSGGKVLLGYFFGPHLSCAELAEFNNLDPANAILCLRFGDLGLIKHAWPILGRIPNWDRAHWPIPDFVRIDPLGNGRSVLVRYMDDDPNRVETENLITDITGLRIDAMCGYGAVEIKLTKLLTDECLLGI